MDEDPDRKFGGAIRAFGSPDVGEETILTMAIEWIVGTGRIAYMSKLDGRRCQYPRGHHEYEA